MTARLLTAVSEAAALLRAGALVAFGTETVYGLGADATNGRALAAVFEAKGRPRFNPLICHFATAEAAFAQVEPGKLAQVLAQHVWPGPLTMVLRRRPECRIHPLASAGLDTVAVRVPGHAGTRALLSAAGVPVAAPSANRSGSVSPTTARHVLDDLADRIAAVLDFGPSDVGVESTVLDLSTPVPVLLRPGGVPLETIEALIGPVNGPQPQGAAGVRSPGMLASHYAPRAPLRLDAHEVHPGEALLAFGPRLPGSAAIWQLSEAADLLEAAARLFAGLRRLDQEVAARGLRGIAAMPVPAAGLGLAINDRLRRAAAPRS